MSIDDDRTPEDKLAELEALDAKQSRRFERRMQELQEDAKDPRVRRGYEALVRTRIAEATEKIVGSVGEANARQLHRLALRLVELDLLDLNDDVVEDVEIGAINDVTTGEIVTAICPDGMHTYWESGRDLIVQRERGGRLEYARVGADGELGSWQVAASSGAQAASN